MSTIGRIEPILGHVPILAVDMAGTDDAAAAAATDAANVPNQFVYEEPPHDAMAPIMQLLHWGRWYVVVALACTAAYLVVNMALRLRRSWQTDNLQPGAAKSVKAVDVHSLRRRHDLKKAQ